jgi:uracil-DNA glycosylase
MLVTMKVHKSWNGFLTQTVLTELGTIENSLGNNYTPAKDLILRFLSINLDEIKVIILGQDPYPQLGVANGRSFQPATLLKWDQPYRNTSIKNLLRLIYIDYVGELVSYSNIDWDKFNIKSPTEWFDSLENQGVLLLNTSLTCEIGKPNSHARLWGTFTNILINYISLKRPEAYWFLFGKNAQSQTSNIASGRIYNSPHPMMGSKEFFQSTCFRDTKSSVNWLG